MKPVRIASAALLAATVLTLAGCSSDDQPEPPASSSTDPSSEPTTDPTAEPTAEPTADPTPEPTEGGTGPQVFESTVTPADGVAAGEPVTASATDAQPGTAYFCVLSVIAADGSLTASNTASIRVVTADADGNLECEQNYQPFEAADENGDTRACPPTEADAEAGFSCAVALADQTTVGATSASVGYFAPASS